MNSKATGRAGSETADVNDRPEPSAGLDRLRRAAPIHLAGIQEYWLSKFSDDELRALHDLLNRLVAGPAPADPDDVEPDEEATPAET